MFIGRQGELAALARAADSGARLVTLIGPGGVGKTRLALEYLREREACFCDVAGADTEDALALAILGSLGNAEPASLVDALKRRGEMLLVLDNFEQLVRPARASIAQLLRALPELRLLVTSRERLQLAGETCITVDPLRTPTDGESDPFGCDAVRLFLARARATCSEWEPSADDIAPLIAIAHKLDGIPLAIELCAARIAVLRPAQLLELLGQRFELLVDRDRSLRASLDRSWGLLEPWEQQALAQCAVFEGGFTLDAVARVLDEAARPPAPGPLWALEALQALHDKSLVRAYDAAAGARRYRLDDSVREYAADKLRNVHHADRHVRIATSGAWLRQPGGECVELAHRPTLRRLLRRLAIERIERPGRPVGADVLIREAWPDERILQRAASSRLRVALSTLRKMGLGAALQRRPDGYLIHPALSLRLVEEESAIEAVAPAA